MYGLYAARGRGLCDIFISRYWCWEFPVTSTKKSVTSEEVCRLARGVGEGGTTCRVPEGEAESHSRQESTSFTTPVRSGADLILRSTFLTAIYSGL